MRPSVRRPSTNHRAIKILLVVIHGHPLSALLLHVHVGRHRVLDLSRNTRGFLFRDPATTLVDLSRVLRLIEGRINSEHGFVRRKLVPLRRVLVLRAPSPFVTLS
jgi:hypothetical protein